MDIPETANTLEGNASQKAHFIYDNYGLNCFADDTGLEVEALNGEPGVHTARYATEGHDTDANVRKLLHELEDKKADIAVDLVPVISLQDKYDFYNYLSKKLKVKKEDIMGFDLYLYPLDKGYVWGDKKEFFTID